MHREAAAAAAPGCRRAHGRRCAGAACGSAGYCCAGYRLRLGSPAAVALPLRGIAACGDGDWPGYCTGGGCAGKRPFGTSAGGRGGELPKMIAELRRSRRSGKRSRRSRADSAAIRSHEFYARVWSGGAFPPRPVNMSNEAIPGIGNQGSGPAEPARIADLLAARIPGFVIAGRLRAAALRQCRAARTMGAGVPVRLGRCGFSQRYGFTLVLGRRHVDGMMQPAVPARRHGGWLGDAAYRSPSAARCRASDRSCRPWSGNSDCRIRPRRRTRRRASPPLGAECLAVPPGKQAQQESFHRRRSPDCDAAVRCHSTSPRCPAPNRRTGVEISRRLFSCASTVFE